MSEAKIERGPLVCVAVLLFAVCCSLFVSVRGGMKLEQQRGFAVPLEDVLQPGYRYLRDGEFLFTMDGSEKRTKRYVGDGRGRYPYGKWFIVVDGVPVLVDGDVPRQKCGCQSCK